MCLIAFSYRDHPDFELIFAGNRDERYDRPTRAARFWDDHPQLLAGKDLEAGGTWLGINRKNGKFGVITNFRDPDIQKEDPPSRGHIALDYLTNDHSPEPYLRDLDTRSQKYNGFNLLTGNPDGLFYYSNQQQEIVPVEPGIHGLSNNLLDAPWPKVQRAKEGLARVIGSKEWSEEELFQVLQHDQPAPDADLPDTGIPKELERQVSPIFIKTDKYGTRCSTLVLITREGEVTFIERRYEPGTSRTRETNRFEFQIPQPA